MPDKIVPQVDPADDTPFPPDFPRDSRGRFLPKRAADGVFPAVASTLPRDSRGRFLPKRAMQ